nr:DUF5688 family protein [uncultured Blautia sp.]
MMEHDIFYFQEQLLAGLREYLPADAGYVYRMETVEKNRETRHALVIGKKTDTIIPTIYMEGYFQAYENGYPLSSICRDICQDILTREPPRLDMGKVQDYEQIKENLRLRLVSREDNRKYLEQGPYRMDTIGAMVVYADLDESLMGQEMGMRITHRLLQGYGVTEGQLFDEAMTQTRMHCPFTLQSMDSLIEEMTGMRGPGGCDMHILTNRDKFYGASVSLYPDTLPKVREMLGEDFYVLPSSVHELILLRKSGQHTPYDLRAMVRQVNREQVAPEEQLSNEVFEYRGKERQLLPCRIKERERER